MATMFHVLASGSSGNASLLDLGGYGILLDFGLGPRQLAQRLEAVGASWDHIDAVLLTHTHGDHCQPETLAEIARRRLTLHCHHRHVAALRGACTEFEDLGQAGLVRCFDVGRTWTFPTGCRCRAFSVRHDGAVTCGFRFDGPEHSLGASWALAYLSDVGSWTAELVEHLVDVDVLAVEFNHDVDMQRSSGRPFFLIRRVLGDHGHLSNVQAAQLLQAVLERSEPGRLQHLVQLHLSQQCNRPDLARAAVGRCAAPSGPSFRVHTTEQGRVGPSFAIVPARGLRRLRPPAVPQLYVQMRLPGWD